MLLRLLLILLSPTAWSQEEYYYTMVVLVVVVVLAHDTTKLFEGSSARGGLSASHPRLLLHVGTAGQGGVSNPNSGPCTNHGTPFFTHPPRRWHDEPKSNSSKQKCSEVVLRRCPSHVFNKTLVQGKPFREHPLALGLEEVVVVPLHDRLPSPLWQCLCQLRGEEGDMHEETQVG